MGNHLVVPVAINTEYQNQQLGYQASKIGKNMTALDSTGISILYQFYVIPPKQIQKNIEIAVSRMFVG